MLDRIRLVEEHEHTVNDPVSKSSESSTLPTWPDFQASLSTMEPAALPAIDADDSACPICLQNFDAASTIPIRLSCCRKLLCRACALEWFDPDTAATAKTCPHCRAQLYMPPLTLAVDLDFTRPTLAEQQTQEILDSAPLSRYEINSIHDRAEHFFRPTDSAAPATTYESLPQFMHLDHRDADFAALSAFPPLLQPTDACAALEILRLHLRQDWYALVDPTSPSNPEDAADPDHPSILTHPACAWIFREIFALLLEIERGRSYGTLVDFEKRVQDEFTHSATLQPEGKILVAEALRKGCWAFVQVVLRCATDGMVVGRDVAGWFEAEGPRMIGEAVVCEYSGQREDVLERAGY